MSKRILSVIAIIFASFTLVLPAAACQSNDLPVENLSATLGESGGSAGTTIAGGGGGGSASYHGGGRGMNIMFSFSCSGGDNATEGGGGCYPDQPPWSDGSG